MTSRLNATKIMVHNISGRAPALGGDPSDHDPGCVVDLWATERHLITGAQQHPAVYFGTLAECGAWVRERSNADANADNDTARWMLSYHTQTVHGRGFTDCEGVAASESSFADECRAALDLRAAFRAVPGLRGDR
jgi:hypothetical protein